MFRLGRFRFFGPTRGFQRVLGTATKAAGSHATDSLELLSAAVHDREVWRVLGRLGLDRTTVAARVSAERRRTGEPGLTPDAMLVIEAATRRALELRRNPSPVDLLVALATSTGPARGLLLDMGLDEAKL